MTDGLVAIVLVDYNDEIYIRDCLNSIREQTYSRVQVYLVDNASADNSVEIVREEFPEVKIIMSEKNLGFGGGCNIGIHAALQTSAEFIMLLNIDTKLEKEMISKLLIYADSHTAVTPKIVCRLAEMGQAEESWYAGGTIDMETGDIEDRTYEVCQDLSPKEVSFMSGCCLLAHRTAFEKTNGFDENYFMYYEDTDFCMQLQEEGIKMLYVPSTVLWHRVGGSAGGEVSCISQYYGIRNRLYFTEKFSEIFSKKNPMSFLKGFLLEQNYFKEQNRYMPYQWAGIWDYMCGQMGRGRYGYELLVQHYLMVQGFYEKEQDEQREWYWAKSRAAKIMVTNPIKSDKTYKISFDFILPADVQPRKGRIYLDERFVLDAQTGSRVELDVLMGGEETKLITIETDEPLLYIPQSLDKRAFAFGILDFIIQE